MLIYTLKEELKLPQFPNMSETIYEPNKINVCFCDELVNKSENTHL